MRSALIVRMLQPADMQVLERVAADVFDEAVDPRWTEEFLQDPRHHLPVAILDGEVIGMASAVHYVHPDKPAELWVNEVGVTPSRQRQGIGQKLLQALFDHARTLGCSEAWVATEEDNIAARRLYRSVGGQEQPMVYVTFELDSSADESEHRGSHSSA